MRVTNLWLTQFRNYATTELAPAPGLTMVLGDNGQGKTNLLEAIGYAATLGSFRGVSSDALVRRGQERAAVRLAADASGRDILIEAEVTATGRGRVSVNRQPLRRVRDLLGVFRVSVFAADDLELVKGGPAARRRWLDDLLVALAPRNAALLSDLERVLRQRNTLLRQAGGRLSPDVATTLDVWDTKLVDLGERLGAARQQLVERIEPALAKAYEHVAGQPLPISAVYEAPWRAEGLAAAIGVARADELRRGTTLVGPHRDELAISLDGLPSRTHASQGEQRSLALALRLSAHTAVIEDTGEVPVLLLDDVFSELDLTRSEALVHHLPEGQAILTTATSQPPSTRPELVVRVSDGRLHVVE
jgi:DNA replication and repair protein RecF